MSLILGIDPGLEGALVLLDTRSGVVLDGLDMPTSGEKTKRRVEGSLLADIIRRWRPDCAAIEAVGAMPGQGVSSSFRFGMAYGAVIGVVSALGVATTFYAPASWMKPMGLKGDDKEGHRQMALALYPQASRWLARRKDHNRADALLLARHHAIKTGRIAG